MMHILSAMYCLSKFYLGNTCISVLVLCSSFQTIKVEFLILVAKTDALDDFQRNFFFEENSFMLNHSDKWLENILTFYQDYGLQPFQSIKVS